MKKILLSSLLAVMAVTSANAKIASTEYADGVAASEAAAAETAAKSYADGVATAAETAAKTAAKSYTDGLTGDVVNSGYINGLTNKTLTGAVENLDSRVKGLTGTGDQAAATKKELADGLATKLGKSENAVSATKATQDGSGNVIATTYATKTEISNLNSTESGTGNFITGVSQTGGKVTVTKGDIAYSDLTGIPTIDTALSADSPNAVQNKVVTTALNGKLGKTEKAVSATTADSATKATQDASGNVITSTYATKTEISNLNSTESGTGNFITGVSQTGGKVTVTKGNIAYSSLTGTPTVDTAMSDSSLNAVQNKVIKSYVDNAIDTVEGDVSGKVSINQGEANKDKGLIVNASGELQLADVATDAELETVSAVANQAKAGVSDIYLSDVMKSGITAAKVTQYDDYASGKQDTLSTEQMAAVNSGATAAIISATSAFQAAVEAGTVNEEGTYVLTAKVDAQTKKVTGYAWENIERSYE